MFRSQNLCVSSPFLLSLRLFQFSDISHRQFTSHYQRCPSLLRLFSDNSPSNNKRNSEEIHVPKKSAQKNFYQGSFLTQKDSLKKEERKELSPEQREMKEKLVRKFKEKYKNQEGPENEEEEMKKDIPHEQSNVSEEEQERERKIKEAFIRAKKKYNTFVEYRRWAIQFLITLGATIGLSVVLTLRDKTDTLITSFESYLDLLDSNHVENIHNSAKLLADYAHKNDTIKIQIASNKRCLNRLFFLLEQFSSENQSSPQISLSYTDLEIISRVFSQIVIHPEARDLLFNTTLMDENGIQQNYISKMIQTLNQSNRWIVKKNIGSALSTIILEGNDEQRLFLYNLGVSSSLNQLVENKYLKRHQYARALEKLSRTINNISTPIDLPLLSKLLPSINIEVDFKKENQILDTYRIDESHQITKHTSFIKQKILEKGIWLYFHTALGGLIWGFAEGFRSKLISLTPHLQLPSTEPFSLVESTKSFFKSTLSLSRSQFLLCIRNAAKFGFRTSIVTSLVPIYFVGFLVTTYTQKRSSLDKIHELVLLNTTVSISLLPWYYLLPVIERIFPYWLGGHVLGFTSFFLYLVWSDADEFKNSAPLMKHDTLSEREEKKKLNQPQPTTK